MTGVRVKVAHVFQGDKKNSEHVLLFRNFFAFTRAPGMTHNADDISSPLGDGQRGWGEREWYLYKNYKITKLKLEKRKYNTLRQGNFHNWLYANHKGRSPKTK